MSDDILNLKDVIRTNLNRATLQAAAVKRQMENIDETENEENHDYKSSARENRNIRISKMYRENNSLLEPDLAPPEKSDIDFDF